MISYSSLQKLNLPYRVLEFSDTLDFLRSEIPVRKSVIVFLMPYRAGRTSGNMSFYAKGRDYHLRAKDVLRQVSGLENAEVFADISAFDERRLAASAGLGVIGKNGLLINDEYGSFCFIGEIVTDSVFDRYDKTGEIGCCLDCGRCADVCPSGGIGDKAACVSHITQKKGSLTFAEAEAVCKSGYIWGCDLCQLVCPMNALSDEPPFSLSRRELEVLSNRQFREKYRECAFSWRGIAPLLRNMDIIDEK